MTTTPEPKLELRRKWVEALRSGEYRQCREMMFRDGGYCCLGVAARVAGISVGKFGQPYVDVEMAYGLRPATFIRLNDDEGKTFEQIAEAIETRPEDLFSEVPA